jgi:hypothetical protein
MTKWRQGMIKGIPRLEHNGSLARVGERSIDFYKALGEFRSH